ncbi:MAG: pentapeptide repeat-containing protein [Caldilineaceae bacterium]
MNKRILIAYASGAGSTAEVAAAMGEVIKATEIPVDVLPAREVTDLQMYSAVVLGSSVRLGRWLPDAINFLEDFQADLTTRPVAYFTTCLTLAEDTADNRRKVLAYMEPIRQLAPAVKPMGIGLFAGSLDPTYRLILVDSDHGPYGDYRNWPAIRAWAAEIAPLLAAGEVQGDSEPLDFREAVLTYADLSNADLSRVDLSGAHLVEATLAESDLRQADLSEADLTQSDLQEADLEQSALHWATLVDSDLRNANLQGANLIGADLQQADLAGANLSQATLNGAVLKGANLTGVDLSYADLNWVDLTHANLRGAKLMTASLGWANLSNADLTDVDLTDARYNDYTEWPAGFDPRAAGCVYIGFFQ